MMPQPGLLIDHKQVMARMPIWVDEGMVELLANIWKRGFYTEWSCQGGNDQLAYISFRHWDTYRGAVDFLTEIKFNGTVVVERADTFNFCGDVYVTTTTNAKSAMYFNSALIPTLIELSD